MIKLSWVSTTPVVLNLHNPQRHQLDKWIHSQRFELHNLCRDIPSTISWMQGNYSGPHSMWWEPLLALFMFTMSYRDCHLFEEGLVVQTPPTSKMALFIPAILESPEGLRWMGGSRVPNTCTGKKHGQLRMIDMTSSLNASPQWLTLPTVFAKWAPNPFTQLRLPRVQCIAHVCQPAQETM